jgi:hypothetical protein
MNQLDKNVDGYCFAMELQLFLLLSLCTHVEFRKTLLLVN